MGLDTAGEACGVGNLGKVKSREEPLRAEAKRLLLLPKEDPKLFMDEKGGMMIARKGKGMECGCGGSVAWASNLVRWRLLQARFDENLCESSGWQLFVLWIVAKSGSLRRARL